MFALTNKFVTKVSKEIINVNNAKKLSLRMSQATAIENNIFEDAISERNIFETIDRLKKINLYEMSSHLRPSPSQTGNLSRKSAVLIAFCHNKSQEVSILFTLRSSNVAHKGQICFPGGVEEGDDKSDPIRTAVRETVEEVGIEEGRIKTFGELNPFPGPQLRSQDRNVNNVVHPVLAYVDLKQVQFNINQDEVEKVYLVPLKNLCKESNWYTTQWRGGWTTPVFLDKSSEMVRIWGLTAGILHVVLTGLLPGQYNFAVEHQPSILKMIRSIQRNS